MELPLDPTTYIRVLKMASQPDTSEFLEVSKIAGAGILLVGFIGFVIFAAVTLSPLP